MDLKDPITPISLIEEAFFEPRDLELRILRLDLLNGNKGYKLKYNLEQMRHLGKSHLVTYGGAYSNHLAAVADAGKKHGIKTTGIIRGQEHEPLNPTLSQAKKQGMELLYVSRELYRDKAALHQWTIKELGEDPYILPEGGSNALAVKGCKEILDHIDYQPDIICCACGTGATVAGISSSEKGKGRTIGFSALRDTSFFHDAIAGFTDKQTADSTPVIGDYHFGGYGKVKPDLLDFVKNFQEKHRIQLDYIYNGKMLFGIYDRIAKGQFKRGTKILAVHSGGVQGNKGIKS